MATTKGKSSSRKKSTGAKKPTAKQLEAQNRARRQMWAVVLFALGILFGALALVKGDSFWNTLHNLLFGLFGWGGFLICPILIYIAVMTALEKPSGDIGHKLWQTFVLVALLCGAVQIFTLGIPETEGFIATAKQLYYSGEAMHGGGLAAGLVGVPLLHLFGKLGASITICLLIFVFVMVITGGTLIDLYQSAAQPVKKLEEAYVERVSDERRRPKFNIDVPLDDEPLPAHPVKSPKGSMDRSGVSKAKEKLLDSIAPLPPLAEGPVAAEEPASHKLDAKLLKPQFRCDPEPETQDKLPKEESKEGSAEPENSAYLDDIISKLITVDKDAIPPKEEAGPAAEPAEGGTVLAQDLPWVDSPDELSSPETEPEQESADDATGDLPLEDQEILIKDPQVPVYSFPPITLLNEAPPTKNDDVTEELKANAQRLVDTLQSFGVQTRIIDICRGPAVTRYELQPSAGVKISKITGLADDIALNLAAAGVRIEAPIPNKPAVGIEVPNKVVTTVSLREIIDSTEFMEAKSRVSVALGKDITGNIALADIAKMPHLLIAGSTGSGKSVCINSIIMSLLFKSSPDEVKFLMVDPKVVELGVYNGIPHLLVPVVTDPRKAAGALAWAVTEMLNRYKTFAETGVRDLSGYNSLCEEREDLHPMPQIVIIIDELADLMMAAPNEVEDSICRLAQMARAAGMHLIIATQRPSVDVITGVIKANIPSRIAFAVSSQVDSRTILDIGGAEKLLGRGDMLFSPVGAAKPIRVQGCFVSDKEIERVTSFLKEGEKHEYDQGIIEEIDKQAVAEPKGKNSGDGGGFNDEDEMLPLAVECVIEAGQASTSLLQRRLKLGYARAARLIDDMEVRGIVGPFEGSKPRQVLISKDRWIEMKLNNQQ